MVNKDIYIGSKSYLSYMIDELKLLFYRKLLVSNNVLIRTLMCVTGVYYDYVSLCSRHSILDPYCSRAVIGRTVCKCKDVKCLRTV